MTIRPSPSYELCTLSASLDLSTSRKFETAILSEKGFK